MKERIVTNFRGQRALLLTDNARERDILEVILSRLGVEIRIGEAEGLSTTLTNDCSIIFIDADNLGSPAWSLDTRPAVPIIALLGSEAPSRLSRMISFGCDSSIVKPIKNVGVYSALVLATHRWSEQRKLQDDISSLQRRVDSRRSVMQAILHHMKTKGVGEDEAYRLLRLEAMNSRKPIEEIAERICSG